jgi:hypothetical protein
LTFLHIIYHILNCDHFEPLVDQVHAFVLPCRPNFKFYLSCCLQFSEFRAPTEFFYFWFFYDAFWLNEWHDCRHCSFGTAVVSVGENILKRIINVKCCLFKWDQWPSKNWPKCCIVAQGETLNQSPPRKMLINKSFKEKLWWVVPVVVSSIWMKE